MPRKISEQYTSEGIKEAVQKFIKKNQKEPSYKDFNSKNNLPTPRQIQRRFGGLRAIRALCGLNVVDYSQGVTRQNIAKEINKRCSKYEADLINKLFRKHHDRTNFTKTVTRHFAYQQWLPDEGHYINIASDVGITDRAAQHVTLIDFFMPSDMESFYGCVRMKQKKLQDHPVSLFNCTHEVLFVCVNPKISQETIDSKKVGENSITILSLAKFTETYL